jgi:hypothetical protein
VLGGVVVGCTLGMVVCRREERCERIPCLGY